MTTQLEMFERAAIVVTPTSPEHHEPTFAGSWPMTDEEHITNLEDTAEEYERLARRWASWNYRVNIPNQGVPCPADRDGHFAAMAGQVRNIAQQARVKFQCNPT